MKKHSPKTVYWTTYGLAFLVVCVLQVICRVAVHRFFGGEGHFSGLISGFLSGLILFFPPLLATLVCRRLGLSKAGREVEIIRRSDMVASDENYAPVEIRNPPTIYLILALLFTFFTLMVAAALIFIPNAEGKIYGFLMAAFFAAVTLGCGIAFLRKAGFVAYADAKGVRGKAGLSIRTLQWTQIASCEVALSYDIFGNRLTTTFDFKGKTGYVLLSLMTDGADEAQIGAFKAAVEYHLSAQ